MWNITADKVAEELTAHVAAARDQLLGCPCPTGRHDPLCPACQAALDVAEQASARLAVWRTQALRPLP